MKCAKRQLVHVAGFNLGLMMRSLYGIGTPRRAQDRLGGSVLSGVLALLGTLLDARSASWQVRGIFRRWFAPTRALPAAA
jgi:hypothetical protein